MRQKWDALGEARCNLFQLGSVLWCFNEQHIRAGFKIGLSTIFGSAEALHGNGVGARDDQCFVRGSRVSHGRNFPNHFPGGDQ